MIKWLTITLVFLFVSNSVLSQKNKELILTTKLPEYLYHSIEGFGYGTCGNDKVGIVVKQKKKSITLYDHENKRVSLLRNYYKYDSLTTIKLSKTKKDITINSRNDSVFVIRNEFKNVDYNLSYNVDKCNPYDWDNEDSESMNILTKVIVSNTGIDNSNKLSTISTSVSKDSIKSKMIKDFFPIPFMNLNRLSVISKDSIVRHIFKTTNFVYDRVRDKYCGTEAIKQNSHQFTYHMFNGMISYNPDNVYTYFVYSDKDGNMKLSKPFYDESNGYYGVSIFNCDEDKVCRFSSILSLRNDSMVNRYFPKNTKTKSFENRIEYIFVNDSLSSITIDFLGSSDVNDGSIKNPLTVYRNEKEILNFFKELDNIFGKSEVKKTFGYNTFIRTWKHHDNVLTCKYDVPITGLHSISYTDWNYTMGNYIKLNQKKKEIGLPNKPVIQFFPSILYNEIK